MAELQPFYADVQSHYDLSDEFFALFLDPTRTYSCAYFLDENYTLEQAQQAKIDLALSKCDLQPGMTLLDIGCGWGSTLLRAIEKYDVNVIGLTLSENQHAYVSDQFRAQQYDTSRAQVYLQGWEQFHAPVDRIVSIGAFEHFRAERYDAFFTKAYHLLPADGRMLLHTIVGYNRHQIKDKGLSLTRADLEFLVFIKNVIFPGGQLPNPHGSLLEPRKPVSPPPASTRSNSTTPEPSTPGLRRSPHVDTTRFALPVKTPTPPT
jgi:cyclopropane-fatty-acyl-phospholipid synthase